MPHIRVRAVAKEKVQELSRALIPELSKALNSPEDNFTLEAVGSDFFFEGKPSAAYPFIEVLWFERPQELKDRAAAVITNHIKALTMAADVIVVFQVLDKESYYENGAHF